MREIVVVLYNIRSLHNVGSIFRTADAVSVSKIYLCGITPSPNDVWGNTRREIAKVALGAEKTVRWEKRYATVPLLKELKKNGYTILALEQSAKSIYYFDFKDKKISKLALVLGNEVKGLPKKIINICDKVLEIPMLGKKESLNVSVAFGIVVFYLRYLEKFV